MIMATHALQRQCRETVGAIAVDKHLPAAVLGGLGTIAVALVWMKLPACAGWSGWSRRQALSAVFARSPRQNCEAILRWCDEAIQNLAAVAAWIASLRSQ